MKNKSLLIVLAILGVLAVFAIVTYNGLIGKDQAVKKAAADVQAAYQKRMDLVGNLVETVKGQANFEKSTLTEVVEARSQASSVQLTPEALENPETVKQFEALQGKMMSSLSRLLVTVERYPELRANEGFLRLQDNLTEIENEIKVERRRFNDAVMTYNNTVLRFPGNIFAGPMGFREKVMFAAEEGAEKAPKVNFGN